MLDETRGAIELKDNKTVMDDTSILDDTEQYVSKSHSKLLEAVSQLDKGQRVKRAERSEPTLEVSEFHLVKSGISDQDTVQIQDLAKILRKKGRHVEIARSIETAKKNIHVLPKPLEKPAAERIKRIVGFEGTKKELKKWNAIIMKNRVADSLQFPLNHSSLKLEPSNEFVKKFRIQSDLEKELAAVEPQKENIEEKDDEFSLTLKEITIKRKEAAKIRAQQSYKEAKARRQNKIKSKKFHRVQKKEKIKQQLKEFEQLQKTDPEAALEKLEQLDKTRAEERMSLRHKNTGKWAKSKQIKAKYDKETRQELAQQLSVSRELTQKLKRPDDSEEEEEDDNIPVESLANDKENPWIGNVKTESEINEFIQSYRKYWEGQNKHTEDEEINDTTKIAAESIQLTESSRYKKISKTPTKNNSNINSSEIRSNDEKENNNENSTVPNSKSHSTMKGNNSTQNLQSSSIDNKEKNLSITKSNVRNKKGKTIKDNNVTLNDKKSHRETKTDVINIAATSKWNVNSLEDENNVTRSSSSAVSNKETINKLFDFMEDKIQDQLKSKLERVTKNHSDGKIRKSKKDRNNHFEEDTFDGLQMQTAKRKPILDSALNESIGKDDKINRRNEFAVELEKAKRMKYDSAEPMNKSDISKAEIDPNKYINVKPKHLNTEIPDDITGGDDISDNSEDEERRRNIVSEAFADDDVVEEFKKEKEEEVKKSQPEDIDLTLPGWGCWGGRNIKVSQRKKKRFVLKVPKDLPRKDENKGDVIIIEEDKPKIREHQVTDLPYPFSSVKDYEASVRMPIGRNFIPENAHRKLIEPTIKTRIGTVIEPMNEDILVKKEEQKRRILARKKKDSSSVNEKKTLVSNNKKQNNHPAARKRNQINKRKGARNYKSSNKNITKQSVK